MSWLEEDYWSGHAHVKPMPRYGRTVLTPVLDHNLRYIHYPVDIAYIQSHARIPEDLLYQDLAWDIRRMARERQAHIMFVDSEPTSELREGWVSATGERYEFRLTYAAFATTPYLRGL